MNTHQQIDKTRSNTSTRTNESKPQTRPHPSQILQRMEEAPGSIRPADVLQLQRTIGNRATGQLLQAKLKLGPAGDRYEQEADQVAKQVVAASRQPDVQRADLDEEDLQAKPLAAGISQVQRDSRYAGVSYSRPEPRPTPKAFVAPQQKPKVQREEMEDELQASANHGMEGGDVDTDVARSIQSAKGGGQPLHDGVRSSMEKGFGADFGGVRVHTGGQADALNRSLNARAFTTGKDIFFGKGQYNPGSTGGQELIAHELTHTVQQGAAGVQRSEETIQRALEFENTDWNSVTSTQFNGGGAGGVFVMYDNSQEGPIVVKSAKLGADQEGNRIFAELFESSITNQGLSEAGDGKKAWALQTPSVRFANQNEVGEIIAAINRTVGPENIDPESKMGKAFAAIQNLQNTTSIYSYAEGEDFTTYYRDTDKKKKERKKVVSKLWENPGMMTLLGRTAALDIFMGNDDRLLSNFNPDNFMVHITKGRQVMSLIDNSDGIRSQFTGEENVFSAWERIVAVGTDPYFPVRLLAAGDTGGIATHIVSVIINQSLSNNGSGAAEDIRGGMARPLEKNRQMMIQNFTTGLEEARNSLLRSIELKINTMRHNNQMSDRERAALRDMTARYFVLRGQAPVNAWQTAVELTTVQVVPQQVNQAPNWGYDGGGNNNGRRLKIGGNRGQNNNNN